MASGGSDASVRRSRRERRRRGRPTLARAVAALGRSPASACAASRGCTRPLRSGVTDQPEFRNAVVALDVPSGPDPATRCARAAGRAQGDRAGVRPPPPAALGPARARPRPARLGRASPGGRPAGRGPRRSMPPETPRRPPGCSRCPIRRRGSGCSCSPRWPTSRRASSRPAGARPSRRPGPAGRSPRAPTRHARSPAGTAPPGGWVGDPARAIVEAGHRPRDGPPAAGSGRTSRPCRRTGPASTGRP